MRVLSAILLLVSAPLWGAYNASDYSGPPAPTAPQEILKEIRVDQKLDTQVPIDVPFVDSHGTTVTLRDYLKEGRPVVLNLVYYECPMLCNQVLAGTANTFNMLKSVPLVAGQDFEAVTISFDPTETSSLAAEKRDNYLRQYKIPGAEDHWHWLTGPATSIDMVADAVGFRYAWDEKQQEYAHASVIFLLTPDGKVSRYFFGIEYSPKDMRLGLMEASGGKIGGPAERMMLLCYHYDGTTGKYSLTVLNLISMAGAATIIALLSFIGLMLYRDFKVQKTQKEVELH